MNQSIQRRLEICSNFSRPIHRRILWPVDTESSLFSGSKNPRFITDGRTLLEMNWNLLLWGAILLVSLVSLHFLTHVGLHLYNTLTFRLGQLSQLNASFFFPPNVQIYILHKHLCFSLFCEILQFVS